MNNKPTLFLLLVSLMSLGHTQRAGFAGFLPYGYPVIVTTTTSTVAPPPGAAAAASNNGIGDRFGQDATTTTTVAPRLPPEAKGDVALVNYLNSLPVDQQPFWFLNWKTMEQHRQQPQTFPTRGNGYVDFASGGGDRSQELLPRYGDSLV